MDNAIIRATARVAGRAATLLLVSAILVSCAPVTVHVIRPYNKIDGLEGDRTRMFIRYRPMLYADHLVDLHTPKGRAIMDIGGALADSYKKGLDGFFNVIRYMQYADYVAKVNFDTLEILVEYEEVKERDIIIVDISLKHIFPIHFAFNNEVEQVVPVEAHVREEIADGDKEHIARETARLAQRMLPPIEMQIYEYLVSTDHEGKYIRR